MAPAATIGDIGIIRQTAEGGIEYAEEKFETLLRSKLANLGELKGWPRDLLVKMTARNQHLYRVQIPSNNPQSTAATTSSSDPSASENSDAQQYTYEWVIEDRLELFLADRPDVHRDTDVVQFLGEDRLLTCTAQEAINFGLATGSAGSLSELYTLLDLHPDQVLDLSPSGTEKLSWTLAGWAPLLAGLAALFLLFELKTPGVGIWAIGAAGFGAVISLVPILSRTGRSLGDHCPRDRPRTYSDRYYIRGWRRPVCASGCWPDPGCISTLIHARLTAIRPHQ